MEWVWVSKGVSKLKLAVTPFNVINWVFPAGGIRVTDVGTVPLVSFRNSWILFYTPYSCSSSTLRETLSAQMWLSIPNSTFLASNSATRWDFRLQRSLWHHTQKRLDCTGCDICTHWALMDPLGSAQPLTAWAAIYSLLFWSHRRSRNNNEVRDRSKRSKCDRALHVDYFGYW